MARRVPEDLIAALGTAPDSEVAARFGRSTSSVRQLRMDRGIAPSVEGREAAILAALAAHPEWSLRAVAKEVGVAITTVIRTKERVEHGRGYTQVASGTSQYDRMRPLPILVAPRGRASETPIARETPALLAALGTDLDTAVADRFDLSPSRVRQLREERGIPPYTGTRRAAVEAAIRAGGKSDAQIARELGVDRKTIRNVRDTIGAPENAASAAQTDRDALIRGLLREHPEWSLRRVAAEAGVTANAVMRVKRLGERP